MINPPAEPPKQPEPSKKITIGALPPAAPAPTPASAPASAPTSAPASAPSSAPSVPASSIPSPRRGPPSTPLPATPAPPGHSVSLASLKSIPESDSSANAGLSSARETIDSPKVNLGKGVTEETPRGGGKRFDSRRGAKVKATILDQKEGFSDLSLSIQVHDLKQENEKVTKERDTLLKQLSKVNEEREIFRREVETLKARNEKNIQKIEADRIRKNGPPTDTSQNSTESRDSGLGLSDEDQLLLILDMKDEIAELNQRALVAKAEMSKKEEDMEQMALELNRICDLYETAEQANQELRTENERLVSYAKGIEEEIEMLQYEADEQLRLRDQEVDHVLADLEVLVKELNSLGLTVQFTENGVVFEPTEEKGSDPVGELMADIGKGGGKLEELMADIGKGGGKLEELMADIGKGGGKLEELMADIGKGGGKLEELMADIGSGGGKLEELMADIGSGGGKLEELMADISQGGSQLDELIGDVGGDVDIDVSDKQFSALIGDLSQEFVNE
uniref:Uncharacterized protein n=1 Tax=Arcella intermedia TaxID=1963864 RepID=A0A6B2L1Z8_9EUKA